jgi:hypothetical protein
LWKDINEVLGVNVGHDFESVAKLWLNENKFKLVNICTTAILWSLWKTRNDMIFQGTCPRGMKRVLRRCAGTLRNWKLLLNPEEAAGELECWALDQERRVASQNACNRLDDITGLPMSPSPLWVTGHLTSSPVMLGRVFLNDHVHQVSEK